MPMEPTFADSIERVSKISTSASVRVRQTISTSVEFLCRKHHYASVFEHPIEAFLCPCALQF